GLSSAGAPAGVTSTGGQTFMPTGASLSAGHTDPDIMIAQRFEQQNSSQAGSLVNGHFNQGANNLDGWVANDPQQVTVNDVHQAVLHESPTELEVSLYQDFVVPQGATRLAFVL